LDADLIAALHPTPAVGGLPRGAALRWIAKHEPFDRGIYAAPVGWIGLDGAEFCVALRSGLVRGNELALYNGAGIVRGSDPGEEWQEIETKMQNFLSVLDYEY
jgi:menaquinone-specific isochorismate synthase